MRAANLTLLPRGVWNIAPVVIVFVGYAVSASASTITLDDFTQPAGVYAFLVPGVPGVPSTGSFGNAAGSLAWNTSQQNIGSTLGSWRTLSIQVNPSAGTSALPESVSGSIGGADGLTIGTVDVWGAETTLLYNGGGAGLGGVDLTAGGSQNALAIHFRFVDAGGSPFLPIEAVVVGTSGGTATFGGGGTLGVAQESSPCVYDLLFSSFAVEGPSPLTNAESISFVFNAAYEANVDFSLLSVRTTEVPEPSTLGMLTAVAVVAATAVVFWRQPQKR